MLIKKFIKGQTMIEVVTAFGVAVMLISVITIAVLTSLNSSQYSNNRQLAFKYAQQGVEYIRLLHESNLKEFKETFSIDKKFCMGVDNDFVVKSSLEHYGCINENNNNTTNNINLYNFAREVIIGDGNNCNIPTKPISPAVVKNIEITVKVSWRDGKCKTGEFCHKAEIISCFSDLNIISVPAFVLSPTPTPTPTPTPEF